MSMSPKESWVKCLELIRSRLNEQQFSNFFSPVKFYSYDEASKTLTLAIPSQYFFEYLEGNYRVLIYRAIYNVFGKETQLQYKVPVVKGKTVVETSSPSVVDNNDVVKEEEKASDLDSHLNIDQTFDTFIEGVSNRLPRSVGQAIADKPAQKTFNPLFLYGPSGCGKTHLVNAIGTRIRQLHPSMRVLYISAHLFQVQYVDSVLQNKSNDFVNFYQSIDCLIIDDIQEFAGQEKTLNTFFHIFNHLHQNGRQIIMSADRPPAALQGFQDRMLTRFKWGLQAELESPDLQLRHDILVSLVKRDGLEINEDVINFIAENTEGSIRELEGTIHSLLAYSVVGNNRINLNFAKQILKAQNQAVTKEVTMDDIVRVVCSHCNVKQSDLFGSSRKSGIVTARQMVMFLADKYTTMTANKIGLYMGGRTHSTVIYGIKTMKNLLTTDVTLRSLLKEVEQDLLARK